MNDPGKPLAGLRVAVLTTAHDSLDARVTHKQAVSLRNLGAQVTVVAPDDPGPKAPPGIRFMDLGGDLPGFRHRAKRAFRLGKLLRTIDVDIYHCHEPESALVALRARRKTGASVIFDCHEFWEEGFAHRIGGLAGRCARWAIRRLLLYIGRRADWVTVVSPPMRDYYNAIRTDGRVDIIYNSPIVESFPLCDQADRDELLVVHDGIVAMNRGIEQMLSALAIARREANVRLKFVGRLEPESETVYNQKVQSLGLQDAAQVTGWLPYGQVGGQLAQGQVGTVALQPSPNNYRGLGNKIFNYLCCGLACVVPAGSATADMVREADCGLAVDVTKPQEIASAWVRLARDGDLRRRLGANGRKVIEQRLGWHCMERELARIFAQVAAEKPRR